MSEWYDRGRAALWAVSLAILTSFTAGATITVASIEQEVRLTAVLLAVFALALYGIVRRTYDRWADRQPLAVILVYFMPFFVGTVVFNTLLGLLIGWHGIVTTLLDAAAVAAVFVLSVYLAFYGGADRVTAYAVDRFDLSL
ncbi:hypothetical protein [Halapricum desulfuricans]|uniref:Uncharacterized protein n=1 Tax=Halapricum desulfuricans TaxID=2841257 RepID=A0A897N6C0_9EURY|nr:hypothetical protein [Halapricum desulfuricans]QSG09930.1 hypothetical protein HSR122_2554 [Halapricum desulfuricans]